MDADDGAKDGVIKRSIWESSAYIVSPEGLVIECIKSHGTSIDDDMYMTHWGLLWGEETWDSYEQAMEAYRDSDGTIVID